MSQESLGEAIGLTFQQVQKYERGANRVGASRLWDLSRVLDVPVSYFFDDMDDGVSNLSPRHIRGAVEEPRETQESDPLSRRETLELVRAYYRIPSPQVRRRVFELTKTLGIPDDASPEDMPSDNVTATEEDVDGANSGVIDQTGTSAPVLPPPDAN